MHTILGPLPCFNCFEDNPILISYDSAKNIRHNKVNLFHFEYGIQSLMVPTRRGKRFLWPYHNANTHLLLQFCRVLKWNGKHDRWIIIITCREFVSPFRSTRLVTKLRF